MTILSLMKIVENSPKKVENSMGTGETAHYEQFLLIPHIFKRPKWQTRSNKGLSGKRVNMDPFNPLPHNPDLTFSFSHHVYYQSKFQFLSHIYSVCKCFQF